MTPTQLADSLDKIVAQATKQLDAKITATQNQVFESIVGTLKGLETDADGYIIQSQANRRIIQKAANTFNSSIKKSPYLDAIQSYLNIIPSLDKENGAYFDFISQGYKPNAQYISSLKTQTVKDLEALLLNEGLESQIKAPLINILNQNINSSAKFTDLLKQVQGYITGTDKLDGRLIRYSKQITQDSLFNYSRAYQTAISSDLKLEWYLYAGGITKEGKFSKGSREFCIERVTKYFHYTEVEKWASLEWSGKRSGTTSSSIFIFCGGYGCSHGLIPVHESIVPKSARNRING